MFVSKGFNRADGAATVLEEAKAFAADIGEDLHAVHVVERSELVDVLEKSVDGSRSARTTRSSRWARTSPRGRPTALADREVAVRERRTEGDPPVGRAGAQRLGGVRLVTGGR